MIRGFGISRSSLAVRVRRHPGGRCGVMLAELVGRSGSGPAAGDGDNKKTRVRKIRLWFCPLALLALIYFWPFPRLSFRFSAGFKRYTAAAGEGELQAGLGGEDPAWSATSAWWTKKGRPCRYGARPPPGRPLLSQENNLYTVYQVEGSWPAPGCSAGPDPIPPPPFGRCVLPEPSAPAAAPPSRRWRPGC